MRLYLDTTALVKLYVAEAGSADVRAWVSATSIVGTSRVAYPEARAALARRKREGALTVAGLRRAVSALDAEWGAYVVVEIAAPIASVAGLLAQRHALRGFEAIHLASAREFARLLGDAVTFGVFESRLAAAARAERLAVLP